MTGDDPRCPVCRAKFRGTVICGRCGVDLAPLQRLVRDAWRARCRARAALAAADLPRALVEVGLAQSLTATSQGERLERAIAALSAASASLLPRS